MEKMITKVELITKDCDEGGYITYAFRILEKEDIKRLDTSFAICTRFPNWNDRELEIGDIGIVEIVEIQAGIDKWYNGYDFTPYKYNHWQFIKFVPFKNKVSDDDFIID